MEFLQQLLKDKHLNETQKILSIAMFMDPKHCPNTNIDPETITLGQTVKSLVDSNKIHLSFSKEGKLLVQTL